MSNLKEQLIMSGNYAQLKSKASDCVLKADNLQEKKDILVVAQQEATQASDLYNATKSDLDVRKKLLTDATADKDKLTSDQAAIVSSATTDNATMETLLVKRGKADGSNGLYDQITVKQGEIDVFADETACLAYTTPVRVTGTDYVTVTVAGSAPTGNGVTGSVKHWDCIRNQYVSIQDIANGNLVLYRIELEQQQAALVAAEATLASMKEAGITGTPLTNQETEVDNIKKFISNVGGGVNEAPGALEAVPNPAKRGLTEAIADELDIISKLSTKISETENEINNHLSDYRTAQADKAALVKDLQDTLRDLGLVINRLQDAIGFTTTPAVAAGAELTESDLREVHPGHVNPAENVIAPAGPVVDVASENTGIANRLTATEGAYGSALYLNKLELAAADSTVTAYDGAMGVVATLTSLESSRKTAVTSTAAASATAATNVDTAQKQFDTCMDALQVLIDNQAKIEVDAAAALLEDFLSKGSQVVTESAAPTVETSVETLVDKTCDSSKVRSLVSQIKAAYTDETDYKALREFFCKDPVNAFFNIISDPCFIFLSEAKVNSYRNQIRSDFAARAKALCDKYNGGSSSGSFWPIVIIIGVVLAVLAAIFFLQ